VGPAFQNWPVVEPLNAYRNSSYQLSVRQCSAHSSYAVANVLWRSLTVPCILRTYVRWGNARCYKLYVGERRSLASHYTFNHLDLTPFAVTVTVTEVFIMHFLTKRPEVQYKVIYICSAKPRLNKTVLRRHLKDVVVDWWSLMSVGRLFQTRGAATANALSRSFLRVRGRNRLPLSADRDEARDGRSATGLIRSAMYCGAYNAQQVPCGQADIVWSQSFQRTEASVTRATLGWHDRTDAGWGPFVLPHGGLTVVKLTEIWHSIYASRYAKF